MKQIKKAFTYFFENKKFVYLIVGLFFFSTLLGFLLKDYLSFIDPYLRALIEKTQELPTFDLIVFIFLNNVQSAFLGLSLGIILGIFPVAHAIMNGTVLGYVFAKVYEVSGISEFWRILPHGIFELPAIFISLGLGLRLGTFVFEKNPYKNLKKGAIYSLILFFLLIVPLLFVAAIIEGLLINLVG